MPSHRLIMVGFNLGISSEGGTVREKIREIYISLSE